jgi:hypothetical protein
LKLQLRFSSEMLTIEVDVSLGPKHFTSCIQVENPELLEFALAEMHTTTLPDGVITISYFTFFGRVGYCLLNHIEIIHPLDIGIRI